MCLKRMRGIGKDVRLVDASFIWTEEHSKRIKVKVTVQKEIASGSVLQQTMVCEFTIVNQQCEDCQKSFTPHTWTAIVQVRQKVLHRRTLCYLEQLILKHDAHDKVIALKETREGMDFHFSQRSHAQRFSDFVQSFIPAKLKTSKHLVSHDANSNDYHYKYAIQSELCPVCTDDLLVIPHGYSDLLNAAAPLMICHKMSTSVHLIDPRTCRTVHVDGDEYWKQGFKAVCARKHLQQYVVLDIEPVVDAARRKVKPIASKRSEKKKWQLCEVEIAREEDLGKEENPSVKVYCHLGNVLKAGDLCLGYDLRQVVVNGESSEALDTVQNDVMLVKKTWRRKEEFRNRAWKLKHLAKEVEEEEEGVDEERLARDEEEYKRDIEEDEDLQKEVQLWEDREYKPCAPAEEDEEEDDLPEVALAQLLEDLTID